MNLRRIFKKIQKLIIHPGKYFPLALKLSLQKLSFVFSSSAFFLQGQMDIHSQSLCYKEDFVRKTGGYFLPKDTVQRTIQNLDPWDIVRRDMMVLLLRSLLSRGIEGDLAEVGVYKGATARLIHHYLPERRLHLFDTFGGFNETDVDIESKVIGTSGYTDYFRDVQVEEVLTYIQMKNDNVKIYEGFFPESCPSELSTHSFAFVHLDLDLYSPTLAGLKYFYEKMTRGGFILVHDYNSWLGVLRAVDEFISDKPEIPIPMPDKSGSVLIVKT